MQRAAKYDFADKAVPSFADVSRRIRTGRNIPENCRGQLLSSVATLVRLAGLQPESTPFTSRHLRVHLSKLTPGGTGLSKKRLQNLRSDLNFVAGLLEVGGSRRYLARLTPAWTALEAMLDRYEATSLKRLMQFASAQGVEPSDLDDAVSTRFLQAMDDEEILKDPRTTHKNAVRAWNKAAQRYERWPQHQLAVPLYRSFWGLAWSAFKPGLEQAVDDFLSAGQDPTADDIFDEVSAIAAAPGNDDQDAKGALQDGGNHSGGNVALIACRSLQPGRLQACHFDLPPALRQDYELHCSNRLDVDEGREARGRARPEGRLRGQPPLS